MRTLLMMLLTASLASCAGRVKPADAYWYGINVQRDPVQLRGYNLKEDYDYTEDGMQLKPDAKPRIISVGSLEDLAGYVLIPPRDFAKIKSSGEKLLSRYLSGELCEQQPRTLGLETVLPGEPLDLRELGVTGSTQDPLDSVEESIDEALQVPL